MRMQAGDRGTTRRKAGRGLGPKRRLPAIGLLLAGLTLTPPASFAESPAGESPFSFEALPQQLLYVDDTEQKPPSFSFERNELRAVEAPTRYRTQSILRYTTALGDTGLQLRVKLPLKLRKLVKVELRF